jgi:hypothetical protein
MAPPVYGEMIIPISLMLVCTICSITEGKLSPYPMAYRKCSKAFSSTAANPPLPLPACRSTHPAEYIAQIIWNPLAEEFLLQLSGLGLGYRFNWYIRGPYSPGLADITFLPGEQKKTKKSFAGSFRS